MKPTKKKKKSLSPNLCTYEGVIGSSFVLGRRFFTLKDARCYNFKVQTPKWIVLEREVGIGQSKTPGAITPQFTIRLQWVLLGSGWDWEKVLEERCKKGRGD